jgi:hypothetical protein
MIFDCSKDVRYASIGNLPSNFLPYRGEFKDVCIRQFNIGDLKLLSRATLTKDVSVFIKAIDLTINVEATRLTIGDFYYILMWHKLHSFPKTPLSVAWECGYTINVTKDGIFVPDSDDSETIDHQQHCKHPNAQLIHHSDIEIVSFEEDYAGIDSAFDYPRVEILPEIFELRQDTNYAMLLGAVQWVANGVTLAEKFEYLETQDDIGLYEDADALNKTVIHGVNEIVTLKCSNCSNTFEKRLDLDPLNFFRTGL